MVAAPTTNANGGVVEVPLYLILANPDFIGPGGKAFGDNYKRIYFNLTTNYQL